MITRNRDILLANIASMYYLERCTQAQIAKKMGYSRSAISRLITEAEDKGIVEIRVHSPIKRNPEMERFLRERFGLQEVIICSNGSLPEQDRLRQVGQLAASYLEKFLHDQVKIGIGWGTSIYETINVLPHLQFSGVQIVQVIGAIGGKSDPRIDGPELAAQLAGKLNGSHHYLHSPLILEDETIKNALMNQQQISETLEMGYQTDVTLLGIGTVETDRRGSSLLRTGYLNIEDVKEIQKQGGVANFCGYILDEMGNVLDIDINQRIMAISLERLRRMHSHVIAVAGGRKKSRAIEAVIKRNLIDTLISDSEAIAPLFN
jgi:deoxyribonucleoside regulator